MAAGAVIEIDGMQWRPRDGPTAGLDEFAQARALFWEMHRDSDWNPWAWADRADEYDAALLVMDQWERAEPNHRRLTDAEIEAKMAESDEQFRRGRECAEREYLSRIPHYDASRHTDRLALPELESRLQFDELELERLASSEVFPGMVEDRRAAEVARLTVVLDTLRGEVRTLRASIGNPDDVVGPW